MIRPEAWIKDPPPNRLNGNTCTHGLLASPAQAKAIGSDPLRARIQSLQPIAHVFGHTHFAWDAVLDGVRYVQAPLCYPLERKHRCACAGYAGAAVVGSVF